MVITPVQVTITAAVIFAVLFLVVQIALPVDNQVIAISRFSSTRPLVEPFGRDPATSGEPTVGESVTALVDAVEDDKEGELAEKVEQLEASNVPLVHVNAYLEALCPDSARFIVNDLDDERYPATLWDISVIKFVMWGNVRYDTTGAPHCQHGPTECQLNRLLNCAINADDDETADDDDHHGRPNAYHLLRCMYAPQLKRRIPGPELTEITMSCIASTMPGGVKAARAAQQCASGAKGKQLETAAKEDTEALDPPHTWVPWVTVDGEPINAGQLSEAAWTAQYVCKAFQGSRPEACAHLPRFIPPSRLV